MAHIARAQRPDRALCVAPAATHTASVTLASKDRRVGSVPVTKTGAKTPANQDSQTDNGDRDGDGRMPRVAETASALGRR